jgi:hypothetical protein
VDLANAEIVHDVDIVDSVFFDPVTFSHARTKRGDVPSAVEIQRRLG